MIEMINSLISKGYAYESSNHVLFEAKKFKDYNWPKVTYMWIII